MTNKILFESFKSALGSQEYNNEKLAELFNEHYEQIEELFVLTIYQKLDSGKQSLLTEIYEDQETFQTRLFDTWKSPLERLDTLTHMCTEIVFGIRNRLVQGNQEITDKFNIATRLHARTVQVAKEVSHLLHGGFADGAFARWRTLHETTTILKFICEGNEDLATRFTDFQSVLRLTKAKRFNDNNDLNFDPIPDADIERYNQELQEILSKYEPSFSNKFGWALKALGKAEKTNAKADYIDIEKHVGLGFLRNHYSFANQYIHAGIDSIGYKLGTSMSKRDLLLAGPSDEGLLEPIQCTSLSLIHATVALISAFPDDEGMLQIPVFWLWHEAIKSEVIEASNALQAKGEAKGTQSSDDGKL